MWCRCRIRRSDQKAQKKWPVEKTTGEKPSVVTGTHNTCRTRISKTFHQRGASAVQSTHGSGRKLVAYHLPPTWKIPSWIVCVQEFVGS
jgi:hypothetical protein